MTAVALPCYASHRCLVQYVAYGSMAPSLTIERDAQVIFRAPFVTCVYQAHGIRPRCMCQYSYVQTKHLLQPIVRLTSGNAMMKLAGTSLAKAAGTSGFCCPKQKTTLIGVDCRALVLPSRSCGLTPFKEFVTCGQIPF